MLFACLDGEAGPRKVEIPESGSNSARRHINIANGLGAMTGEERIGRRNVLALPTHALMEEGYVVFLAYVGMWSNWGDFTTNQHYTKGREASKVGFWVRAWAGVRTEYGFTNMDRRFV